MHCNSFPRVLHESEILSSGSARSRPGHEFSLGGASGSCWIFSVSWRPVIIRSARILKVFPFLLFFFFCQRQLNYPGISTVYFKLRMTSFRFVPSSGHFQAMPECERSRGARFFESPAVRLSANFVTRKNTGTRTRTRTYFGRRQNRQKSFRKFSREVKLWLIWFTVTMYMASFFLEITCCCLCYFWRLKHDNLDFFFLRQLW